MKPITENTATPLTAITPINPLRKPTSQSEGGGFYNVPTGTATHLIHETLLAGEHIADLPARKSHYNRHATIKVQESGQRRQITYTTQKAELTLELADIDKLTGSNKPAKKLFIYTLIKANEQAIFSGELGRDYVSFPLQDLVSTGSYSRLENARKGFNAGLSALTSLKVKGTIRPSKKKERTISALEVLFTGGSIKNNQCTIYLNPRINWGFIVEYFTILPRYYFSLPNRAADLLYYIFYRARQSTHEIEQKGYFTISFRAIQERLQLPSEKGLNNPQRDIKVRIEEAITAIEDGHHATYNNMEFSLLPVYDDKAPISEYLDNGYLRVSLSGDFATKFIELSQDTTKAIESRQKQRQRITEKAIAINAAKKMEADSDTGGDEPPPTD